MKIIYTDKSLPNGYEVSVANLNAVLLNGQVVDVDDEAIHLYEIRTGRKFSDLLKGKKFSKFKETPNVPKKEGGKN